MNYGKRTRLRARLCAVKMYRRGLPALKGNVDGSAWSVWYEEEYRHLLETYPYITLDLMAYEVQLIEQLKD